MMQIALHELALITEKKLNYYIDKRQNGSYGTLVHSTSEVTIGTHKTQCE